MEVRRITDNDVNLINQLAGRVWEPTYRHILSKEQLDYMFGMMYSPESILRQLTQNRHEFLLLQDNGVYLGFASYEINYRTGVTKIHKLYIMPEAQGKGAGSILTNAIEKAAKAAGNSVLTLNVNRFNSALQFYTKTGFIKTGEEDIDIGQGYLMEDYIMEKQLHDL
ncbi:GNAT family N-acetyltransferase [Flavobacterium sp. MK4S-17]|uniref:GNAT family N-acetyltransferase n=1 Tax=Flavobacterium sp. MK4S-17 TaxID=2543737 RepID=UPI00135BE54B|nr:GNAT family N-acetyltransferase [Flavobacterium sp. MK4S-17]